MFILAGLFGMFDYTKEGPGVKKREREKKGFFRFFELYLRNFWGYVKIGLIYSIMSLPVITNGMANAGITHIARSTTREKHTFLFSDFMDTVKSNWKQSLLLGIINVVVSVVLGFDIWYFWNQLTANFTAFAVIGLGIAMFLLICVTFMKYYIWTLTITFSLSVKNLIKNSFNFVFLNLWKNILISVVLGICYAIMLFLFTTNGFTFMIGAFILIFVFPGFKASLVQANVFGSVKKFMIDPYYANHKGEDIEKRLALGLEVPEDEMPKDEEEKPVFSDETPNTENNN